jgi:hypothetical protein
MKIKMNNISIEILSDIFHKTFIFDKRRYILFSEKNFRILIVSLKNDDKFKYKPFFHLIKIISITLMNEELIFFHFLKFLYFY